MNEETVAHEERLRDISCSRQRQVQSNINSTPLVYQRDAGRRQSHVTGKQSPLVGVIRRAISSRKDYWRRVGGRRPARWVVSGRHQRFAGDMNCDMNQRRARYRSGRTVRHKTSFRALANILQTREARAARRCGDGCGS